MTVPELSAAVAKNRALLPAGRPPMRPPHAAPSLKSEYTLGCGKVGPLTVRLTLATSAAERASTETRACPCGSTALRPHADAASAAIAKIPASKRDEGGARSEEAT